MAYIIDLRDLGTTKDPRMPPFPPKWDRIKKEEGKVFFSPSPGLCDQIEIAYPNGIKDKHEQIWVQWEKLGHFENMDAITYCRFAWEQIGDMINEQCGPFDPANLPKCAVDKYKEMLQAYENGLKWKRWMRAQRDSSLT